MGRPHEGSIRRPIAPWANALTTELHLTPFIKQSHYTVKTSVNELRQLLVTLPKTGIKKFKKKKKKDDGETVSTEQPATHPERVSPVGGRARAGWRTTTWAPRSARSWCCTGPCPPCATRTLSSTCRSTGTPCSRPRCGCRSRLPRSRGSCPGGWCSRCSGPRRRASQKRRHRISASQTRCFSSTSAPVHRSRNDWVFCI